MPLFSANLRYLFQEYPLVERFAEARKAGFRAVEYPFPYGQKPAFFKEALDANDLELVLINSPPGDWERGERGLAGLPGRETEFKKSIDDAIYYATALGCRYVHIMAGMLDPQTGREGALSTLSENLKYASDVLYEAGLTALIEPFNSKDMPGYLITNSLQARAIMAVVNSANLGLLLNLYHIKMAGEDVQESIRSNLEVTLHMQIAGVPGRAEPSHGVIDYADVFELLDMMGYSGWIGCEYSPQSTTLEGLKWASLYGLGSPFQTV